MPLLILASLNILANGPGIDNLKVGVDVDLGNAKRDGLLDLVLGNASTTVQNQREVTGESLDLAQALEGKALPVFRIQTVDVTNTASEEVDAQVGNLLALLGSASSPEEVTPSSVPPIPPTSASMDRPRE